MNFSNWTYFNRNAIAIAHDAAMAGISFVLALYIRLGEEQFALAYGYMLPGSMMLMGICVATSLIMRQYRGLWRYASMRDMLAILKSVSVSLLVFVLAMFIYNRLDGVPRSVFFINWMLLLGMLAGPRFLYRALKDHTLRWSMSLSEKARIPVLLIGASHMAERFIRDMERDDNAPYTVYAIADDDPKRIGRTIHNVRIYSGTHALPTIVRKLKRKGLSPQKIIVADEAITGERLRTLLAQCEELGLPLARLPHTSEMKHGIDDKPSLQPIAVEDLLGRAQHALNREAMRALVQGKKVLITGSGGTIGGELTRQIASYGPSALLLFEQCEFNLYKIEREIAERFPTLPLVALLADVRDAEAINHAFDTHRPELIFHAAAIKHVPLSEANVEEAILTNVFGTYAVARAAVKYSAQAMVMISTDKAVNPTNVMGASKRLAESVCQAVGAQSQSTRFITVRFGNVLGSTGSVVPLFSEQLARGGPITVTHPDITRYFMTVREAVELVLQAAVLGVEMHEKQEYVFVLDMGKPVKILDLATQMITLAGLKPHEDVEIVFTGLRPGEKLFEELFHISENAAKTTHESIMLASPRFTELQHLQPLLDELYAICHKRSTDHARATLHRLVPEFTKATS